MKVIVVSDIHGASEKLKIAIEFMKTEDLMMIFI